MTGPIQNTAADAPAARTVWLIARRELAMRLRTRSFVLGTLAIIVVLAGYLLLQAGLFGDTDRNRIGLSGQAAGIEQWLRDSGKKLGVEIETSTVRPEDARAMVESGDLDAVVSGTPAEPRVLVKSELDPQVRAALNGIAQREVLRAQLASAQVDDPDAVLADAAAAGVEVTALERKDPQEGQRIGIGLVMAFLLFLTISTYGAYVAQGVVEEKASRVVEILLATVRPWQLLLGKVLGLGLVGFTQIVVIGVVGVTVATASGAITVSGVAFGTLLWGIGWYVLGWFLYAALFAASASLVSRQEDLQGVLLPLTMTLTVGFVVGLNLIIASPGGTATAVLSLIPLLAPILMPGRIATGDAAAWEVGLAVGLTVAAVAAVTWLGGTVYRNAVLRTGSRMKLAAALRDS